jgi:CrcB protein
VPTDRTRGPVDPDVDLQDPGQARDVGRREVAVLAAVAVGGVLGAEARWGLAEALPHANRAWPWATLITNVAGCLLIGVLMVLVVERGSAHHLVRPFLGVGVLGGFTTFSTFAVDTLHLLLAHRPGLGLLYLGATPLLCFAATAVAVAVTRAALPARATAEAGGAP